MGLFHIVRRADWEALAPGAIYEPVSLREEGFIHLSEDRQLLPTATRHFADEEDLLVLSIARARLESPLRYEEAHGQVYPHLYGPLDKTAIVEVVALPRRDDGSFDVPEAWKPWEHYFR